MFIFCWEILPSYIWVLSILTLLVTSDKHTVVEWDIKSEPKVFFFSEEKELVVFPPPFTLLNNKRNAVSVLSTLWALKYSFLVHSFTKWGQRCETISYVQKVLLCTSYQSREKGEKRFKRLIWREKYLNHFLKIWKALFLSNTWEELSI